MRFFMEGDLMAENQPEMRYKCPYGCSFECQNKKFLRDHIILKHLTPEFVYQFANYIILRDRKHYLKYKIEAVIGD